MARAIAKLLLAYLSIAAALAQDAAPRVPAGRDPGGIAIGLLSTGIDYTLPSIASRLARDGEGEVVAWDFERNDRRPFDKSQGRSPPELGGDVTALASAILKDSNVRLVVASILPADPASFGRAVVFLSQTRARVAVVPMWSSRKQDWEPFAQAALQFKDMLFIAPAGETAEPSYPAALNLENTLILPACSSAGESIGYGGSAQQLTGSHVALATAARAAVSALAGNPKIGIAELKRLVAENSR